MSAVHSLSTVLTFNGLTSASYTTIYTCPAGRYAVIPNLCLCNRGTAGETFEAFIVPSGGTPSAPANADAVVTTLIPEAANDQVLPGPQTLTSGQKLVVKSASTQGKTAYRFSVVEYFTAP